MQVLKVFLNGCEHLFFVCLGLSLDEEVPDYDLDSEDEEWLNLQTNEKVNIHGVYQCNSS